MSKPDKPADEGTPGSDKEARTAPEAGETTGLYDSVVTREQHEPPDLYDLLDPDPFETDPFEEDLLGDSASPSFDGLHLDDEVIYQDETVTTVGSSPERAERAEAGRSTDINGVDAGDKAGGPVTDPDGFVVIETDKYPRVGAAADDEATETGVDPRPVTERAVEAELGYADTASVVRPSRGSESSTLELPHRQGRPSKRGPRPLVAAELEPTQARATVLSNWSKAVAGLRVEAARSTDDGIRGRLLTVAAGLTWQLIGDVDDAEHLFDQALEVAPELTFAHRERALMRLREGREPVLVLADAAAGLKPRDRYDHRRRVRGRFYLLATVLSLALQEAGKGVPGQAAELGERAREDLSGTLLSALWEAYRAFWEGRDDLATLYLSAIRACRLTRLRAALLADLATGLWSGRYERGEGSGLDPVALLQEAVSTAPPTDAYDSLLRLIAARDLSTQHRQLAAQLERGASEELAVRAAAVAEAVGEVNQALGLLELFEDRHSPAIDWRILRLAAKGGEPDRALAAARRLRERASAPLWAAALALEEASLQASEGDTEAWAQCMREAYGHSADLDTARLELGRHVLLSGSYRELMDLRGHDWRAKSTGHTRRGEILESRLSSPTEAVAEYERALELDPGDRAALRALERIHGATGDYDALSQLHRKRAEIEEDDDRRALALRLAAHVDLFERGEPEDAWPLYEHLHQLRGSDPVVRFERISLAFRLGEEAVACEMVDAQLFDVEDDDEAKLLAHDRLNQVDQPLRFDALQRIRERTGDSIIVDERIEMAALAEGRHVELLAHLEARAPSGDPSRDQALLRGHLQTVTGNPRAAVRELDAWSDRYTEDRAAELLLDEALQAAGELDRLEDRWESRSVERVDTGDVGRRWVAWRRSGFGLEPARALAEVVDANEDRRLIWGATLAATSSRRERGVAAARLLETEPDDFTLRAIAESALRGADDDAGWLRLIVEWVRGAEGLDRDWLLHCLAGVCLAVGRAADAAAMWADLLSRRPELVVAGAGRVRALRAHGDEDGALEAERDLRRAHAVAWDDLAAQRRRLENAFEGAATSEARALVALALSELAESQGERDRARLWARRAAETLPGFVSARRRLAGIGRQSDDEPALPNELRTDVELGHHLLFAGEQPERALGVFLAAVVSDAAPEAIAGLMVLGRLRGEAELTVEALRGWSRRGRDANLLVHLDLDTARLAELECDDADAAIEAYERAWTRRPESAWIGAQLARLVGRVGGLTAEQRERLGGLAGRGADAAPALYHLATALPASERADTLAFILSLDPHFLPAEWALMALPGLAIPDVALARRGRRRRCPALLVYVARRALTSDDATQAESLLYEAMSFSSEEDIASFGGPYDGLIRMLRDRGRGIELIALGEDLVGRASTGAIGRRLLEAAVRVALMPRTSRAVARTALLHLVEKTPRDRVLLRRAVALTAQASDWERVIGLLEAEIELLEDEDPGLVPLVWWEVGEIRRRSLDDVEGALEAYQRAYEHGPEHFFVHSAIGRLLIEQGRWEELVEHTARLLDRTHAPESDSEPDSARRPEMIAETIARVHVNLAGIEEFHRLDTRRALEHYLEALAEHPENRSAMLGTIRVAERAGQPAAAAVAMEALASYLPGSQGQVLLLRAAEIAELNQGETVVALAIYRRLAEQGLEPWVRFGLEACELAEGGVDALFRGLTPVSSEPALRELLSDQRMSDWEQEDDAPVAVWASRIFRDAGDTDGRRARRAAARLGEMLGDASSAADLIRLGLLIGVLRGASPDYELMRRLVLLDPADEVGLLRLEAAAEPGSAEERWAIDARVRVAPHGLQRAEAMASLLRHFAARGQDDQLWDTLDRLANEAPELPLATHYRSAMATNVDEPTQAAERLEQEAKVAGSKSRSAQLWLKAAKLRRRQLGEVERAVADLWSALEADPTLDEAFGELREVLLTQGDLEGLYQLFDLRYRGVGDRDQQVDLLARMAELAHHRLEDPARAAWCHRQIIRHDPTQVRSYRILAEILSGRDQDAEVAELLESVVAHTDRRHLKIKTLLELAQLYVESLGDEQRAEERFRDVLALDGEHQKARSGLAKLAETGGRWEEAAQHLERLARAAGNRPRASILYLRLANALDRAGGADAVARVGWALRRAVEVRPDHVEAIRALTRFVDGTGATRPIELIVRQVADRFGGDEPSHAEDRALRLVFELFERLGWHRRTEIIASVLRFLGYQTDRTDVFLDGVTRSVGGWERLRPVPPDETAAVFPPQLRPAVINVLRHLESTLVRAFPSRAKLLGASRKTRVGRSVEHPGNAMARLLGRPDTEVFECLAPLSRPVLEPGSGPSLLLSSDFDADACDDGAVWSIAYALAPGAMGVAALARLPATAWMNAMVRIVRAAVPDYLRRDQRIGLEDELSERLDAVLTRRSTDAVAEELKELSVLDYDGLEVQHRLLQVSFARLAALACQDLHLALTEVAVTGPGPTSARAMVPFLIGPEFTAIQRAAGVVSEGEP